VNAQAEPWLSNIVDVEDYRRAITNSVSSKPLNPSNEAEDVPGAPEPSNTSTSIDAVFGKEILETSTPSPPTRHNNTPLRSLTSIAIAIRPDQSPASTPRLFQDKQTEGLRLLYAPANGLKTVADIVFIHGLTGTSEKTWLDKQSGVYWPLDLLAADIPNIRILAFGYDADVTKLLGAVSQNDLRSHGEALLSDLAALRDETNTVLLCFLLDYSLILYTPTCQRVVTAKTSSWEYSSN
jgi:hypothetical protein